MRTALVLAFALFGGTTLADPRVVADTACPRHGVVIEAFATCDGDRSARAADELARLGYRHVVSIVDGFEGDVGADGRRSVNGWKNAGLPWTAWSEAALIARR